MHLLQFTIGLIAKHPPPPPLSHSRRFSASSDANGALLVYDITDHDSFNKVRNWIKELRKIVGQNIVIVVCGNKIDLEKNRGVEESEALEYCKSVGAVHVTCSAKTGRGVNEAFLELTKAMLKQHESADAESSSAASLSSSSHRASTVQLTDDSGEAKSTGCC